MGHLAKRAKNTEGVADFFAQLCGSVALLPQITFLTNVNKP